MGVSWAWKDTSRESCINVHQGGGTPNIDFPCVNTQQAKALAGFGKPLTLLTIPLR